jgi:energy-coupling factor transporter ATP-binding protein EcfA2
MPQKRTAPAADKFAWQRIRRHFHPAAVETLVTTSRFFPDRLKVELARPFEELTAETGAAGFAGLYFNNNSESFAALLDDNSKYAAQITVSQFEEVELGAGIRCRCLKNGLWLGGAGEERFAAYYFSDIDFSGDYKLRLEIAVLPGEAGARTVARILARFESAIREAAVLRGRVLSFERDALYGYAGLKVHAIGSVAPEEIILPDATLELINRNILRFAEQRAALAALGLPVRKGVLLYGPPGTGKTHTIRYIASVLRNTTVLLVSSGEIKYLRSYIALARMLQPAVVVVEDVDLIAEDRDSAPEAGRQALLNSLLNEMDGLREDAEIMFILTTNRPEVLEPALAARPGRIDQAIEIPLPDEACRRALARLYAAKMNISDDTIADITHRTKGVTASFIKELMRRAAQSWLEAGGQGVIPAETFARAIEEMTLAGGRFNAKLLGAGEAIGFVRAA